MSKKTAREIELEAIVKQLAPAARDILWCALVWNDHNFDYDVLRNQAKKAAKALGFDREQLHGDVGPVNDWFARIDKALRVKP